MFTYLPYDLCIADDDAFTDELFYIESIVNYHPNAHIVVSGDFNVDFARNWRHTEILNDFCDRLGLSPTVRHYNNAVNYTYHFNMKLFSLLDFSSCLARYLTKLLIGHEWCMMLTICPIMTLFTSRCIFFRRLFLRVTRCTAPGLHGVKPVSRKLRCVEQRWLTISRVTYCL